MSNLDNLCKTGSICISANSLQKKNNHAQIKEREVNSDVQLRLKLPKRVKSSSLLTWAFKPLGSFKNASLDFKTKAKTDLHHQLVLVFCKP